MITTHPHDPSTLKGCCHIPSFQTRKNEVSSVGELFSNFNWGQKRHRPFRLQSQISMFFVSWSCLLSQTITSQLTLNSWQKRPWPPFLHIFYTKIITGTLWEPLQHRHTSLSPGHTAVPPPIINQAMKLTLFKPTVSFGYVLSLGKEITVEFIT